jgi:hypothetical protein
MNIITIELSKEDRKLLEGLMGSVTLLASVLGSTQPTAQLETAEVSVGLPVEGAAHLEPVTVEEEAPVAAETPAPEVAPVSLAEFQKAVTQAVAKGPKQKAAAKEIINKYATSVSAVPEDKRADVIAELAKI